MAGVVGAFGAIDQWAALEGESVAVRFDLGTCEDAADGHFHFESDNVAAFPRAGEPGEAFFDVRFAGCPVDRQLQARLQSVGIVIEIARHWPVAKPTRDPEVEREGGMMIVHRSEEHTSEL